MCYLLSWIKESAVGCLEFTIAYKDAFFGSHASSKSSFALAKSERVDPVGARKEIGISWIFLNVFPASVRPSARHELQVLLWNANFGL